MFPSGNTFFNIGFQCVSQVEADFIIEVVNSGDQVIVKLDFLRKGVLGDRSQLVGPELDIGELVGFNIFQAGVGEVQDVLVGSVVGPELVSLKDPRSF